MKVYVKKELANQLKQIEEQLLDRFGYGLKVHAYLANTGEVVTSRVLDYVPAVKYHLDREFFPQLQAECEMVFELPAGSLKDKTRERPWPEARFALMSLVSKYMPEYSSEAIAHMFGRTNYTTVLHGCKKAEDFKEVDKVYRQKYERLEAYFTAIIEELKTLA